MRNVGNQLTNTTFVFGRDIKTAGIAEDVTVLQTCLSDCRCVNNRKELVDVTNQQFEIQGFVGVVGSFENDVFVDGFFVRVDDAFKACYLFVESRHSRREKTSQTQFIAFFLCESTALIEPGISQKVNTPQCCVFNIRHLSSFILHFIVRL